MTAENPVNEAVKWHRAGKVADAKDTYERVLAADPDNALALHYLGLALMQEGDLVRADSLISRAIALGTASVNALADLGAIKAKKREYEASVSLLSQVLTVEPAHLDALRNLATVYELTQRLDKALPLLEKVVELRPEDARASTQLAQVCFKLGGSAEAVRLLRDAISNEPAYCSARLLLGEVLEEVGRFRQARVQYLHVLRREPGNPIALARLLQLRDGPIDATWAARAEAVVQNNSLPQTDSARLRVAMGFYFDRQGDHDRAFAYFTSGNETQRQRRPFDLNAFATVVNRLISTFSASLFEKCAAIGSRDRKPVFIIGMPRSGTTLVEQILASHPAVAGGGELATLMTIASQFNAVGQGGFPYPEGVRAIRVDQAKQMAQRYIDCLDHISKPALRVTDKQPFNFMHLGLAQILFPAATFIHCQRDPMDTCLSCYFVSFSDSFAFASDLGTLGHYYRQYARLMTHWQAILPKPVLTVQYEALVTNHESVVRELIAHCGLPWDDRCLKFYETKRMVRTPSRWQVRQPIYADSIGRWRRYERHLGPLLAALHA